MIQSVRFMTLGQLLNLTASLQFVLQENGNNSHISFIEEHATYYYYYYLHKYIYSSAHIKYNFKLVT